MWWIGNIFSLLSCLDLYSTPPPPPRFWFHYIKKKNIIKKIRRRGDVWNCLALLCCPVFRGEKSSKLSLIVLKIPSLQSRMFFTCVPVALPTQQQQHLGTKLFFFFFFLIFTITAISPSSKHTQKKGEEKNLLSLHSRFCVKKRLKTLDISLKKKKKKKRFLTSRYIICCSHPPSVSFPPLSYIYYTAR